MTILLKKLKEALVSVLPVAAIVFVLNVTSIVHFSNTEIGVFLISAIFLILGIGLFPPREPRALRLLSLAALVSSLCLSIPGDPSGPELTLFCTKSGEWGGILRTGSGQSSAPLAPPRESLARGSCGTRRVPHTCQRLLHPQL